MATTKGKLKTGKINIDIYGAIVNIVFADNLIDAVKLHKITGITDEEICSFQAFVPNLDLNGAYPKGYYCFFLNSTEPHTIAHECLHLALKILAHRGIYIEYSGNNVNDEACAYLLGFLTKKILAIQAKPHK